MPIEKRVDLVHIEVFRNQAVGRAQHRIKRGRAVVDILLPTPRDRQAARHDERGVAQPYATG